jgi:hypothetical protein
VTENRTDRLDVLRRNLDQLTEEAEALADNLERDRHLAGEEAVGAELLATRDLVANLGIALDTATGLADVYARQMRHLFEDYAATWSSLSGGQSPAQPLTVLSEHLTRRVEHVTEGVNESIELVSTQSERAWEALYRLWAPFAAVVRQDWSGPQRRGRSHEQPPVRRQLSAPVR